MLQPERPEVAQVEQQRAPRRAAIAAGQPERGAPSRPRAARPSAISRSSHGAAASSDPDQFSSPSPGAARMPGTLIGLTMPRVPWRTRAVPA